MHGVDGLEGKNLVKLTWEQFQEWQRWGEFSEKSDNPPMTVDMSFVYRDKAYHLDMINHVFAILTDEWQPIETDVNFLKLVTKPIEKWDGRTFCELIEEMWFVD
ncbi:MAG: hypothetical protein MJ098_08610 [Saccharofermentans sp.]|nr:hypothetical protein [Saccharofermentans sp.]